MELLYLLSVFVCFYRIQRVCIPMSEVIEESFVAIFIPVSMAQAVHEVKLPKAADYRRKIGELLSVRLGFNVPHLGVYLVMFAHS